MTVIVVAFALLCFLPAIFSRLTVLAPTRQGWLFYYPNIFNDYTRKRLRLPRSLAELLLFGIGATILALQPRWGLPAALLFVVLLLVLVARNCSADLITLNAGYAHPDSRWRSPAQIGEDLPPGTVPHPSHHPDLILNLEGPFVQRRPSYDLGDLCIGRSVRIVILLGNHSRVPSQVPAEVTVRVEGGLDARLEGPGFIPPLMSGQVAPVVLSVEAVRPGGPGAIWMAVRMADCCYETRIGVRSTFETDEMESAVVARYPGGRRAAFAWRGDMDHYDRASFQSIEGLEYTLGLAARYRFPQTMYLSSRLCLDEAAAKAFYDHYGVARGAEEIPAFIQWLKQKVELCHTATYPFETSKLYCLEIGNHMHLHYGTDAAAALENGWSRDARMGAGRYAWQGAETSSFAEQRDNALECKRLLEETLGFSPLSWAMPDSTNDANTPRAVESAGCRVTSDVDAAHKRNVLLQPPPHHPEGTNLTELTKRYPGDPEDGIHLAMILYWIHRAWRRGIPVVYMGHQHLRLFAGRACLQCTESLLRHVLTAFRGDLWVSTVYGIGMYWGQALSHDKRVIAVEIAGERVTIRHSGSDRLTGVPVDVTTRRGRHFTVLVDLNPGSRAEFGLEADVRPVS